MKHHIFLSYSRRDAAKMRDVRTRLQDAGLRVWTDEKELRVGVEDWPASIEEAIEGAQGIVVLLSPDAKESGPVRKEIRYAQSNKKKIFPLLVRGSEDDAVPFDLITAQWIDVREDGSSASKSYELGIKQLLHDIRLELGLDVATPSRKAAAPVREDHPLPNISAWNPFTYAQMIGCLFWAPSRYVDALQRNEVVDASGIRQRLAHFLIWLPLLLPVLGLTLDRLPATPRSLNSSAPILATVIVLAMVLTAWLDQQYTSEIIQWVVVAATLTFCLILVLISLEVKVEHGVVLLLIGLLTGLFNAGLLAILHNERSGLLAAIIAGGFVFVVAESSASRMLILYGVVVAITVGGARLVAQLLRDSLAYRSSTSFSRMIGWAWLVSYGLLFWLSLF